MSEPRKHWPDCVVNHGGTECDMGPDCGLPSPGAASRSERAGRCEFRFMYGQQCQLASGHVDAHEWDLYRERAEEDSGNGPKAQVAKCIHGYPVEADETVAGCIARHGPAAEAAHSPQVGAAAAPWDLSVDGEWTQLGAALGENCGHVDRLAGDPQKWGLGCCVGCAGKAIREAFGRAQPAAGPPDTNFAKRETVNDSAPVASADPELAGLRAALLKIANMEPGSYAEASMLADSALSRLAGQEGQNGK